MDHPTKLAIEEMLAALDESDAQIDAGEVLRLEDVLSELQQELDQWRMDHSPERRRELGM